MPNIELKPIKTTDAEVQLFAPDDYYNYEVDNRPLRNLIWNDQQLYSTLSVVVEWLNSARSYASSLSDRLDSMDTGILGSNISATITATNEGPYNFTSTVVLKLKTAEDSDWVQIEFQPSEYTVDEVVEKINLTAKNVLAKAINGKLSIETRNCFVGNYLKIASVSEGSTANTVFGFSEDGEFCEVKPFSEKLNTVYEEIVRSRFQKSSLDEFLSVAHLPDGRVKASSVDFDYFEGFDFRYRKYTASSTFETKPVYILPYNSTLDVGTDGKVRVLSVRASSWYYECGPFPALAVFYLFPDSLDIYDCTDPTKEPSLWMRFNIARDWESGILYREGTVVYHSGNFYEVIVEHYSSSESEPENGSDWETYWRSHQGFCLFGTPKKVDFRNGILAVLTSAGAFLVDFVRDEIYWFNSSNKSTYSSTISNRNVVGTYLLPNSQFSIDGSQFNDMAFSGRFLYVTTDAGLNIFDIEKDKKYVLDSDLGSSCTKVVAKDLIVAFSMGHPGFEKNVFLVQDVEDINSSGKAEDVAVLLNEDTNPGFDRNVVDSLELSVSLDYPIVIKSSSSVVKCYHATKDPYAWVQVLSPLRDASFPISEFTIAHWILDRDVAIDEVVDDVTNNQIVLVAKEGAFLPQKDGALSLYKFDGEKYLMSATPERLYSEDFMVSIVIKPEILDESTLISKWEGLDKREWKLDLKSDGSLVLTLFDEDSDSRLVYKTSPGVVQPGFVYLITWLSKTGLLLVNGNKIDVSTEVESGFIKVRDTNARLFVGCCFDNRPIMHYKGLIGPIYLSSDVADGTAILWNRLALKQLNSWLNAKSTRIAGSGFFIQCEASEISSLLYTVCGGKLSKVYLGSGVVEDLKLEDVEQISFSGGLRAVLSSSGTVSVSVDSFSGKRAVSRLIDVSDDGYYVAVKTGAYKTPEEVLQAVKVVDGSGSGLDADLLDGLDSSQFVRSDTGDTLKGDYTIIGNLTVTGLIYGTATNADKLDGFDSSQFVRSDTDDILDGNYTITGDLTIDGVITGYLDGTAANAEKVGGLDSSQFLRSDTDGALDGSLTITENLTVNGTITGYLSGTAANADKLDGLDSSQFVRSDTDDVLNGNYTVTGNLTVNGVITANIDGTASNADKLDGLDSSQFLRSDTDGTLNGSLTITENLIVNGTISTGTGGLDADTLDGLDSTQFLRSDVDDEFAGTLTWTGVSGVILKFGGTGYNLLAVDATTMNVEIQANWNIDDTYMVARGAARIELDTQNGAINLSVAPLGTAGTAVSAIKTLNLSSNGNMSWDGNFTVKGNLTVQGTITESSDEQLKQDIRDLDLGLSAVEALRPVRFRWKDEEDSVDHFGLIAQEVQKVVPEVVYSKKGLLSLSYSQLIPILINAVKELKTKIEKLEQKLKEVEVDVGLL